MSQESLFSCGYLPGAIDCSSCPDPIHCPNQDVDVGPIEPDFNEYIECPDGCQICRSYFNDL
jgi:hypothetical protein